MLHQCHHFNSLGLTSTTAISFSPLILPTNNCSYEHKTERSSAVQLYYPPGRKEDPEIGRLRLTPTALRTDDPRDTGQALTSRQPQAIPALATFFPLPLWKISEFPPSHLTSFTIKEVSATKLTKPTRYPQSHFNFPINHPSTTSRQISEIKYEHAEQRPTFSEQPTRTRKQDQATTPTTHGKRKKKKNNPAQWQLPRRG